ncbi:MAG: hypothetical protein ACYSTI_10930 [Planctomycetota bacterium]|jgi:hypothetical protein
MSKRLLKVLAVCVVLVAVVLSFSGKPKDVFGEEINRSTEKEYIGRAGGYLSTLDKQDKLVAQIIAGWNTGTMTMDDVKHSLNNAKFIENTAWRGDYLKYGELIVPEPFSALDKKLHKTHQRHRAAFGELLQYYADYDTSHIINGQASFRVATILRIQCFNDLKAYLKIRE